MRTASTVGAAALHDLKQAMGQLPDLILIAKNPLGLAMKSLYLV